MSAALAQTAPLQPLTAALGANFTRVASSPIPSRCSSSSTPAPLPSTGSNNTRSVSSGDRHPLARLHSTSNASESINVDTLRDTRDDGGLDSPDRTYHLEVIQHPERTAEFGNAVLSRLPLAPPLVVQLVVRDRHGNPCPANVELPFLVAHLSLHSEDGSTPVDIVRRPVSPGGTQLPADLMLYGTLVSSPHHLQNLRGQPGDFFIFPDVSVGSKGRYQLVVTLMRIASTGRVGGIEPGGTGTTLTSVPTRTFEVVSLNEYVAPAATSLTQTFHRQGARIFSSSRG